MFCGAAVEHVAATHDPRAEFGGGHVEDVRQEPGVGHDFTVYAQPGHAAVRIDREPDVGEPARTVHCEQILAVAGER